jgi:hypothetical protein
MDDSLELKLSFRICLPLLTSGCTRNLYLIFVGMDLIIFFRTAHIPVGSRSFTSSTDNSSGTGGKNSPELCVEASSGFPAGMTVIPNPEIGGSGLLFTHNIFISFFKASISRDWLFLI